MGIRPGREGCDNRTRLRSRNSALGKLLARTVRSKTNFDETVKTLRVEMQRQYQVLLDDNQDVLNDISSALQTRISEWAHPDARLRLQWKQDPDKSVRVDEPWAHILAGEGDFEGELARFGHGLQRSYLLALLQELAAKDATGGPTLILACEEPELVLLRFSGELIAHSSARHLEVDRALVAERRVAADRIVEPVDVSGHRVLGWLRVCQETGQISSDL